MAFTTPKYELIFNDIYQPPSGVVDAYRIRIYLDGYTGAKYPLYGTTSPITIETINADGDSYVPIIATKATLNIYNSPNFDIQEFLNADDNDIMITVENGTASGSAFTATGVIWRGTFLPSENIQFSVVDLASYSLVFVDGLGKLKQSRLYFDTLNLFGFRAGDKTSIIKYISGALSKSDLSLDIWVNQFYQTASVAGRNIESMSIRNNYFCTEPGTYLTYYEILEQLCRKYGWECYYKDDHWHIESYGCLTRNATPSYFIYNNAGNYQSTYTTTYPTSIQVDGTNNFKQLNRSMLMGLNIPKNSFKFIHRIQNAKNILNAYFQSWTTGNPDAFDEFGTMTYSKLNPTAGGVLITSYTTNMLDTADYLRSESVKVKAGDLLNIEWNDINIAGNENRYKIMLIPDDVTNPSYFIDGTASFTPTDTMLYRFSTYSSTWKNQTTVPVDGTLSLFIYNPYYAGSGTFPYQELLFFNIVHYGTTSQVNNFDSVQYLSYVFNKFNAQDMTYDIGNYFTNSALITTLNNYLNYNNDDAVMSSVYLGTMVDANNIHVLDEFGRQTNSTVPLYQLVAEDVGVDMLKTQYTILGEFKSLGYWINRRFDYSLGTSYNYLLKDFKWDLKQAIQSSSLFKINYNAAIPFNPNFGTPTLNLKK
jgi:hypothetical protein